MKKFDIMAYIRKFQILIVIASALAGIVGYIVLNRMQTYTATAIIRYANSDATQGLAPDGSTIDTTEIYSAKVISEVFARMGLDYARFNVDDMRGRVTVEALQTDEKAALDEAMTSKGEEVVEKPVEYKVSFEACYQDADNMEEFARQFLDEMLDIYISYYGEEHVNDASPAINDISNINNQNYDYLEKVEILSDSISAANDALSRKVESADEQFRSATTGYSFSDLQKEFALLKNVRVADLYSYILDNRVTQDRAVLLAKYENRIKEYNLSNETNEEHIEYIRGIIDAYVKMMRESGNTDITYEYILQDVDEDWYTDENGVRQYQTDQTVEYDTLLEDYISERTDSENALVEIAYCEYILDVYNGLSNDDEGIAVTAAADIDAAVAALEAAEEAEEPAVQEEAAEEVQVKEIIQASSPEVQQKAQEMIDSLVEKTNTLYQILEDTNSEYNAYIGAKNINLVAGIAAKAGIAIGRYVILIVIAFGVVGCVGAIVVGRLADIFDYYVYVDRNLNIPNRTACDRKIAQYGKRLLPGDFVCISIKLDDVRGKNHIYGRKETDRMIREFVHMIQNSFSEEPGTFLGMNSVGHFLIFSEHMSAGHARTYARLLHKLTEEYNVHESCKVEYSVGIAEAKETGIYQIRELMLASLRGNDDWVREEAEDGQKTADAAKGAVKAEKENGEGEKRNAIHGQLDELRKALYE